MAKKPKKAVIQELPNITGPGVEALVIPALDKLISKYEAKKDARCKETPGELAAKKEMMFGLQQHRNELPEVGGKRFYRFQDRDYILEDKLVIKHVHEDETE